MKPTSAITVAVAAAVAVLAAAGPAAADELTGMTAVAQPSTVDPGDTVTISITVSNLHDRKITYDPIEASDGYEACEKPVGTVEPGQSATVACQVVITGDSDLNPRFSVRNAASEHNETSAHASAVIMLNSPSGEPSTATPTVSPSDSPSPGGKTSGTRSPDQSLPTTGSSITPIAAVGAGLVLLGLAFGLWRWRANRSRP
ncbi:LPXTG-motif cell wall-anchored protein [Stackebrandtia albiflava]|uniref:LPXTG-motif cell wall-anchored protein n=1 Tax=Stackebrandtia albiflava TaxID=406432 RepID=A0A562URJ4_9ACTN|nr:LPXTG cell wall anchor domain-containing protein [Stackebrandtia albiflava]TWJ08234.1 LPXTG-motif cell wall-anchored protein [Stackebrandtia albiflava]